MHGIELALQMIDALMQACVDQVFYRHRRPGDSQRFEGLAQVPLNWVGVLRSMRSTVLMISSMQ